MSTVVNFQPDPNTGFVMGFVTILDDYSPPKYWTQPVVGWITLEDENGHQSVYLAYLDGGEVVAADPYRNEGITTWVILDETRALEWVK